MDYNIITRYLKSPYVISLLLFLSIMGPGIITSSIDNDANGVVTYSLAGSQFGYLLLWTLIPMTIALAVCQEMGIRMGVVTGKGLSSLIRERTGVRLVFFIMVLLLAVDFGNTLGEFSGIAVSGGIFGIPSVIAVPVAALFIWVLVERGSYLQVEKILILASGLYFVYIISGYLAHPDWHVVATNTILPTLLPNAAFITMIVGVVGTTIAPWMMFYIQASVAEKGVPVKHLQYSRLDAIFGAFVTNFVALFIIVACGATIFLHGIPVNNVADISAALVPLAGSFAAILFAFGFLNASVFSACVLPVSTAHYVCEALGLERGVSKTFGEAPAFHGLYTGIIILSAIFISLPNVPYLSILFLSQVGNGILLPFILIYMLTIANDKTIMGEYVNSRTFNYIAWVTVVIMVTLSIVLVVLALI